MHGKRRLSGAAFLITDDDDVRRSCPCDICRVQHRKPCKLELPSQNQCDAPRPVPGQRCRLCVRARRASPSVGMLAGAVPLPRDKRGGTWRRWRIPKWRVKRVESSRSLQRVTSASGLHAGRLPLDSPLKTCRCTAPTDAMGRRRHSYAVLWPQLRVYACLAHEPLAAVRWPCIHQPDAGQWESNDGGSIERLRSSWFVIAKKATKENDQEHDRIDG